MSENKAALPAIYITDIAVGDEVLEVYRDPVSNGIFGIDASYTDQVQQECPSPFGGYPLHLGEVSQAQFDALKRLWERSSEDIVFEDFLAKATPELGGNALMIPWQGMIVGIEPDGHTHT